MLSRSLKVCVKKIKSINILKDKMSKSPQFKPPATELYKYRFNKKKLNKNEY